MSFGFDIVDEWIVPRYRSLPSVYSASRELSSQVATQMGRGVTTDPWLPQFQKDVTIMVQQTPTSSMG